MINRISISNFKSFKSFSTDLARLTILAGLNGSGKSSLIQALLLFKENLRNSSSASAEMPLSKEGAYDFGLQEDVFYCYSQLLGARAKIEISTDALGDGKCEFVFDDGAKNSVAGVYSKEAVLSDAFKGSISGMQYISAGRREPITQHAYDINKAARRVWGRDGANAVAFYNDRKDQPVSLKELCVKQGVGETYLEQVNYWMGEIISSGIRVVSSRKPSDEFVDLRMAFTTRPEGKNFQPKNVGYGISIVLPIVIALLGAKKGDCILFENPEAHLHPAGQAKLGRMLAIAAAAGVQLIVETHSDHIVNGIRVAIKERKIRLEDVAIRYFAREEHEVPGGVVEQYTVPHRVVLDEGGDIVECPEGFLDEWSNQLTKLWSR